MEQGTVLFHLIRPRLSAMVAAAALAGWALHPAPGGRPLLMVLGVFLLAGGCTALNQVQERDIDARMLRTRNRPLPTGRLQLSNALFFALALAAGGLSALATSGAWPFLTAAGAVMLYNGIYTPLKRRTPYALLPGALCGALPPVIGWTAAGGHPADFRAILLAGLVFLWQVPHFWLFVEKNREDYRLADLPMLDSIFPHEQMRRLTFVWTAALAAAAFSLPAFNLVRQPIPRAAAFSLSLWILGIAIGSRSGGRAPLFLFRGLTVGIAGMLATVIVDGFLT